MAIALGQAWPRRQVLPGFGPTFGLTLFYLSVMLLVPLGALFAKAGEFGLDETWRLLATPRVAAAFRVSFGIAFAAAILDGVIGLLIAWVLVRYRFPGRRLIDAVIDLPFALPTAVAGIALSSLYADNGLFGAALARLNIAVAFTPLGIFVALLFVGLPFAVRTIQPVLADIEHEPEEAALTLGARRSQIFRRVIGEYGSVIFIAGNMPGVSEIVPVLIVVHLEQFDYAGAAALATAMLASSFAALFFINLLQAWTRRRHGG
jgi:sulfate/thiosulfate transport system permease protein